MRPAGAEASALANASRELLNAGDAVGAERVLSPVFNQLRSDPSALHLMGLIKRAQNQLEAAERHFRSAIAYSLSEGGYYNDLGVVLQAQGKYDEAKRVFRAALALSPKAATARVNLVGCLMAAGELAEAEREARAYIAAEPGAESWTLLGQVQRAQERHEDALTSAQTALKYAPKLRGVRYNYATALDRLGRSKEALDIYEKLARQELDSAELTLNFARALYADGRKKDAEAVAERGVELWPGATALHAVLARMRWLRGEGENCTAVTEAAIAKRPRDLSLRLACADALHRGKHHQKALAVLDEAIKLAPDAPALLTAMAIVLDELDRPLDALRVLRRAAEMSPDPRTGRRNLLTTLLRAGQPEEALKIARELGAEDPHEQFLIAVECTAMRMLGDPDYQRYCDYERLVRTYQISPPKGFFTAEEFNATVSDLLRAQHRTNSHPLDQNLHNGTQTGRSMLTLEDVNVKAFMVAVDGAVRDYIKGLNKDDLAARRRGKHYRYGSLWSTRLTQEGYLPNHVHDRGWISSAYYAAILPAERPKDPRNGWLKFGEPNRPPAGCGPEKLIEPRTGLLVLFPSYMWHGTIPFEGSERLSAAFDVQPG
jgi:Flp pilus assembly protein TadD